MKLKLLAAVGTAALLGAPTLAHAGDDGSGWYLRGNVGYGTHTDMDFDGALVGDVESEGNGTYSLGVGYELGNNWRVELDGASLWTDLGQIGNVPSSFAKLRTNTAMLNAIYDFSDFGRWEPYVGAGVGFAKAQLDAQAHDLIIDGVSRDNPACTSGPICAYEETANSFAWQLLAGVGYQISDKLTWDTHYRYLDLKDLSYGGAGTNQGRTTLEGAGAHSLLTGFRYNFGGSAPAMVVCWDGSEAKMLADCPAQPPKMQVCWNGDEILATASCPDRPPATQICWNGDEILATEECPVRETFVCTDGTVVYDSMANCPAIQALCENEYRQEIIYYDFDRGQSAETRATIQRILDTGQYCRVDNIRVVGHTDTSGSAAYNQGLSERRAKDARDELVRQGINPAIISSSGMGETQPFVDTGDGVKEQLNRRTEVLIQLTETGVNTN